MSRKIARLRETHDSASPEDYEAVWQRNWFEDFKLKCPFYNKGRHKQLYAYLEDSSTNMVLVDGPAGTGKTYISVYAGLELLQNNIVTKIMYIRSVIESASKSLGALPGDVDEKFLPYAMPLIEKVQEITDNSTCKLLQDRGMICTVPVNFVRGLTFNNTFVIIDEAQNLTRSELVTILTRFGKNTKYVICGDSRQCDIPNSGYKDIFNAFNTDDSIKHKIHTVKFLEEDIVRSKILRHIVSVLDTTKNFPS